MTAIQGYIKPTRRPGELGVHSLDHFHFRGTGPRHGAETSMREFGLDVGGKGNLLTLNTFEHTHTWGTIGEGPRKKFGYVSFGAFEDDMDRFSERLQAMGIARLDPPPGIDSERLVVSRSRWRLGRNQSRRQIVTGREDRILFQVGPRPVSAGLHSAARHRVTHPRRLAHVLMFTRDVRKAIEFYTRVLGLRLSDHSGDNIAFLHGIHGSDHHMIAFARSEAPGHHHFSWDVGSVDEIGAGAMHMLGKGFTKGWGLGRHVLGSNYFHYVRDPWGSYSEYSADIDYVPVTCDWQGGDQPADDSFYAWGPNVPEDFVHNYET